MHRTKRVRASSLTGQDLVSVAIASEVGPELSGVRLTVVDLRADTQHGTTSQVRVRSGSAWNTGQGSVLG